MKEFIGSSSLNQTRRSNGTTQERFTRLKPWGLGHWAVLCHTFIIGHLNERMGDCGVFCRSGMSMYGLKTSWIVGKIHHDEV